MEKEYKERLVAALRSGEFKQGMGALNKNGKLCCMGVMCEVEGIPKTERNLDPYSFKYTVYGDEGKESIYFPPVDLQLQAGLTKRDMSTLARLNDVEGKSFEEIADWIEEHL